MSKRQIKFVYRNGLNVTKNELWFRSNGTEVAFKQDGDYVQVSTFDKIYYPDCGSVIYQNPATKGKLTYDEFVVTHGEKALEDYRQQIQEKVNKIKAKYDKTKEEIESILIEEYSKKEIELETLYNTKSNELTDKFNELEAKIKKECEEKIKKITKTTKDTEAKMNKTYEDEMVKLKKEEKELEYRIETFDRHLKQEVEKKIENFLPNFSYCYGCKYKDFFSRLIMIDGYKKYLIEKWLKIKISDFIG